MQEVVMRRLTKEEKVVILALLWLVAMGFVTGGIVIFSVALKAGNDGACFVAGSIVAGALAVAVPAGAAISAKMINWLK